jgi:hypothetical protein
MSTRSMRSYLITKNQLTSSNYFRILKFPTHAIIRHFNVAISEGEGVFIIVAASADSGELSC